MVNINEFEAPDTPDSGLLEAIFHAQHSLMEKYIGIEAENGLLHTPDCPVDLDSPKGQARLKDFAWRIVEELGEALEAARIHAEAPEHYNEELIDALHFMAEFSLLAGLTPEDIRSRIHTTVYQPIAPDPDTLRGLYQVIMAVYPPPPGLRSYPSLVTVTGLVTERLAISCNFLKNKPWKRTHMLTDKERFKDAVADTWVHFILLAASAGLGPEDLYGLYFRKKQVNDFRIRSRY